MWSSPCADNSQQAHTPVKTVATISQQEFRDSDRGIPNSLPRQLGRLPATHGAGRTI